MLAKPLPASQCQHQQRLGIDAAAHFNSMNEDIRAAIVDYVTDSDLVALALQSEVAVSEGEIYPMDETTRRESHEQALLIEEAMTSLDKDLVVWRGTDESMVDMMVNGGWGAFCSTSHDEAAALYFANKHERPALVRITIKAGHPLLLVPPYLAQKRDEAEVLLDRSSCFARTAEAAPHAHRDLLVHQVVTDGLASYVELG